MALDGEIHEEQQRFHRNLCRHHRRIRGRDQRSNAEVGRCPAHRDERKKFGQRDPVRIPGAEDSAANGKVIEQHRERPPRDLGCKQTEAAAKGEVESDVIDQRGQQRRRAESQQHEVDSHRVEQRIEMRRRIAGFVHGPDRLLHHTDRLLTRGHQHVEFELIPRGGQVQQAGREPRGMARNPVCVSESCSPTSSRMAQRVAVLPI